MKDNLLTLYMVTGAALVLGLTGFYFTIKLSPDEVRIGRDKNCPEDSWLMSAPDKKNTDPTRFYNDLVHVVDNDLDTNTALLDCKRNHECIVRASMDMMAEEYKTPQTEVELRERVSKPGECASAQTIVLYKEMARRYR